MSVFCNRQQLGTERRVGSFEPETVRLLETWYAANIRHPYPDDVTLAALATGGGISVKQVRKWLANRRVRTCNTLTYNGSVHPRRLRRLRRQHRQGQADRAETTEPRQPVHYTPVPPAAVSSSSSAAGVRPAAEFYHNAAFQTSTPLSGAFRRRGNAFEVDLTARRDSAAGFRHHPYFVAGNVPSVSRRESWLLPTVAPASHRAGHFTSITTTAAAAASFASIHQMATGQLNVFNVFNSS